MLHELVDFLSFGCILPGHSQHELLHFGDIGLGHRLCFVAAGWLPCHEYDAVAIAGWRDGAFDAENESRTQRQRHASGSGATPEPP